MTLNREMIEEAEAKLHDATQVGRRQRQMSFDSGVRKKNGRFV